MSVLHSLRKVACGCLLAVASTAIVTAQSGGTTNSISTDGVGAEYAVIGTLPGDQVYPRVCLKRSGGFLVWQDNITDGDGTGISAVRLDGSLSGLYNSFRVNVQGAMDQERPDVAALKDGGAVFTWQGGAMGFQKIFARFFSGVSNSWVAGDVQVNTHASSSKLNPAVAVLTNGNVVVVWSSLNQVASDSMQDIFLQMFTPLGQKIGAETRVNQFTPYNQRNPAVAALPDGRFVVTWVSEQQQSGEMPYNVSVSIRTNSGVSVDIYARYFAQDGSAYGSEFPVTYNTISANPQVAAVADGSFVVAWTQRDLSSRLYAWDIFCRHFPPSGLGGNPQMVNTFRKWDQLAPVIAAARESFMIAWTSMAQDGSREGVYGRYLLGNGVLASDEFRINTTTPSQQIHPAIAANASGSYLAVWSGFVGGINSFDIKAQRYVDNIQPLLALDAPFVFAPFETAPVVSNGVTRHVYQPRLCVSWPSVAGLAVTNYQIYLDGNATPFVTLKTNVWVMTSTNGLLANELHTFQVAYTLDGGRQSPLSAASEGQTWNGMGWPMDNGRIPAEWMTRHFGIGVAWPAWNEDVDHDGMTMYQEFLTGTDPTDARDALKVSLRQTHQGTYLDWRTHAGLFYQVQTTASLGGIWVNLGGVRFAPGSVDSLFVSGAPTGYYRVLCLR